MNKPFPATAATAGVAPITADELVARGCRRIVSYSLERPRRAEPSRQERHRARLVAEEGLKQINFPAAEDEGVRANLRTLGRSSRRPEVATALGVLVAQQDDAASLALLARFAEADFRAAAMRLATGSGGEGKVKEDTQAPANETVAAPPPCARRPIEAVVLRRIGPLPDEQVEAVAIAASPKDHRIRTLALQARRDPKVLSEIYAFARLEPERRRNLLAVDDATLGVAQTIAGRPELGEVMRALSRDKRLFRQARAQAGLVGRARSPEAGAASIPAERTTATPSTWRDRWLPSWLRFR